MKLWNDCSNKEKIERWQNALRVLKSLTPHERRKYFNMANWGVKTKCGTVACAAGHCGLDSWFRRRGFILIPYVYDSDDANFDDESFNSSDEIAYGAYGAGRFANKYTPTDFFGMVGTDLIFHNSNIRPVSRVIKEIQLYIKHLETHDMKYLQKLENMRNGKN